MEYGSDADDEIQFQQLLLIKKNLLKEFQYLNYLK